eukprot:CAMPEP_0204449992 /NCGR_PEP_ID=MMETSP0470-20130426/100125_1 /ASSEMBLY_ACC=CAM_ASM_000385 /TAXON_ID=2969 /ORGANISM="Oxyrrhis marina" /LENGTH=127 /DNA_ID=CAMNT_0051449825 /DNA_START=549 /DNA_END=932 /DNA_ORIENTATION=+
MTNATIATVVHGARESLDGLEISTSFLVCAALDGNRPREQEADNSSLAMAMKPSTGEKTLEVPPHSTGKDSGGYQSRRRLMGSSLHVFPTNTYLRRVSRVTHIENNLKKPQKSRSAFKNMIRCEMSG